MFEDSIDTNRSDKFAYKLQLVREMNKFCNKAVEGTESELTSNNGSRRKLLQQSDRNDTPSNADSN